MSICEKASVEVMLCFVEFEALQFTLRIKSVLARVLPILGSVKDLHRPIFANGINVYYHKIFLLLLDHEASCYCS